MKSMIKVKSIVIFLSLLCSFVPMSFYYISMGYLIIPLIRVIRVILLAYYTVSLVKRNVISKRLIKMLLFFVFLLISTLSYGGGLTNFIDNFSIVLIVLLMAEQYVYCCNEEATYHSLKDMYTFFFFMMIINTISMIVLPQGVYRVVYERDIWHELSYPVFFLNTENRMIEFELPLFLLSMILYEKKMINKLGALVSFTLIGFTIIKAMSLTSIVGICVTAIIMLVIRKKNINSRCFILYPIVFLFQFAFEAIMTNTEILTLIGFIFGRVDTVRSRYALAQQAMKIVSQNFLMGVGAAKSGRLLVEGSIMYWVHNHALDTLVQSGVIGFLLYINNLLKPSIKRKDELNKIQKIIFAGMIGILCMGMTESFIYSIEFYLILSLTDIE